MNVRSGEALCFSFSYTPNRVVEYVICLNNEAESYNGQLQAQPESTQ